MEFCGARSTPPPCPLGRGAKGRDPPEVKGARPVDVRELESLVAVVDKGTISRAGAFLGLSQPAVSKHIAKLEEELGVSLLVRGHGRSVLTPEGKIVYGHAQAMLEIQRRVRRDIAEAGSAVTGLVRIAASSIPGNYLLPPRLARFREEYPGTEVEVLVSHTRQALGDLVERRVDVAVVGSERFLPGVDMVPFFTDEVVLVVSPQDPLARRPALSLEEAARALRVGRTEGSGTQIFVEEAFKARGVALPRPPLRFDHASAVVGAVAAGGGPGIVSRQALPQGEDVVAIPLDPRIDRVFFLAHGALEFRAVALLVDFLLRETKGENGR